MPHLRGPDRRDLLPGTYFWCRCPEGHGAFCKDHRACSNHLEFTMIERRQLDLCSCRKTRTPPVCDGTQCR